MLVRSRRGHRRYWNVDPHEIDTEDEEIIDSRPVTYPSDDEQSLELSALLEWRDRHDTNEGFAVPAARAA